MDHRTPPKPESYLNPKKGYCKWCSKEILNKKGELNLRAYWHKDCVHEYKMIYWVQYTKKIIYKRDKGVCSSCGCQSKKWWHLDHIKPLIESNGEMSFWEPDNLQTLCKKCHIKKTSIENTERAILKRSQNIESVELALKKIKPFKL